MLRDRALRSISLSISGLLTIACAGCHSQTPPKTVYQMGERIVAGSLSYNVVDTTWKPQLGESFKLRLPDQRYFLITISITNGAGNDLSVPLLQLEGSNGQTYQELDNGEGVDNWLGVLRTIAPAQTIEGKILFDVPLSSYRLRLPDGSQPGQEHYVWAELPLRIDSDTPIAPTSVP